MFLLSTQQEVKEILKAANVSETGTLDFEEFYRWAHSGFLFFSRMVCVSLSHEGVHAFGVYVCLRCSIFVGLKIFSHLDRHRKAAIAEQDLIRTLQRYGLPSDKVI